jgi:hypothetical protein
MSSIKSAVTDVATKLLETLKKEVPDYIAKELEKRFDELIVPYEDEDDPAKPSVFKDEFIEFIKDTVSRSLSVSTTITKDGNEISLKIKVGDTEVLGYDTELSEKTTDGLMIIGTILQGIVGTYVLVTTMMTSDRGPEGRFGTAFLVAEKIYRSEALTKGWDPSKKVWKFSNFPGCPGFFEGISLDELIEKAIKAVSR